MEYNKEDSRRETERGMRKEAAKELSQFKNGVLSMTKESIYDSCNKIRFYECVGEYFQRSEKISAEYLQACGETETPVARLWELYIRYEETHADTWADIEDLLSLSARERKVA